jgi:hippurate hydrolase
MFAEDFAFMLEKVPGCYFGLGAGPGKSLHDPGYDFNDALLEQGPALLAAIAAKALPA